MSSLVSPFTFGNFTEPAPILKTDPNSANMARTIIEIRLLAIRVTGLSRVDDLPPAIWFRASSKTTIKPSDQIRSIQQIVGQKGQLRFSPGSFERFAVSLFVLCVGGVPELLVAGMRS